ncbi:hypothetical protein HFP51_12725 [Parasphingopyxis sp. CP4]|uniref:hypothetical protein n=1 Tax=Parasphingopyxis sp. CP4 TaxID=2724527 RepID=UPI00159FC174|nr:hypothetical protein [Parasphingopyxis sp. CP4]QLC22973.1 hypothetical protein HFP51_12725 [Parasphingopyxis sp. CP4]
MDKDSIVDGVNRWILLAANIGVIAGIFFLAFELRQNTVATRMEAASNFQNSFSEIEFFIAQNPEFAELLRAGRDGEELTGAAALRLTTFYGNVLRTWQNAHLQFLAGALDEDVWLGSRTRFATVLNEDRGLATHWRNNQSQFSPAFNDMVSSLLRDASDNRG